MHSAAEYIIFCAETPAAREGGLEVFFSVQAENQVQEVASVLWP